ncbi:MAG: hypothetical protein QHH74_11825 [Spirochaetota bacterium]|nr:hypothetical protein [Spirochaetota bacterium]
MIDFIQGQRFWEIADMVYYPEGAKDCNPLENTFCPCALKERNIIYTHTMYVKQLFEIIKKIPVKFVIITHNCDENVDNSYVVPDNVVMWYSQNVNVNHPKIESIPIGLENDKWFKNLHKKEKIEIKLKEPKKYKNLVYLNSNVKTNPKERQLLYDLFGNVSWVTVDRGINGQRFNEYIDNIYNHQFVFCPDGNGIDTHRLWETLYLGSIPIVKKSINTWFYNEMPILYVDNWDEINETLLFNIWNMFDGNEWNRDMLTFEYWKNKIMSFA